MLSVWGVGCSEFECSVGPVGVVVLDVAGEHRLEVATPENEDPVEAVSPDGSEPTFGVGVRLGCAHRGAEDPEPFAGEHAVERRR